MRIASVGMILFVGVCLAALAVACGEGEEEATPTAAATATAIPTPTIPVPTIVWPVAETPSAAATPGASPTPGVAACPDDDPDFCTFAARVEQAIAGENAEFFVGNSTTQSVLCTEVEAEVGYLCGPEQIGETITGVSVGREASEGTLVAPDEYRDFWIQLFASALPAEEDSEGSGELRIWGLAYPIAPARWTPRSIVLTYIGDTGQGPERQAISLGCEASVELSWGQAESEWQINSLLQHVLALGLPRDTAAEWRDWAD